MKYHSTVSKKTLMRKLGLSRAGHDLDEITSSPNAEWKRPWWVRSVKEPTIEIDWNRMERFDARTIQQASFSKYVGEDKARSLKALKKERTKQWIIEGKPGWTLKDRALDIAARQSTVKVTYSGFWRQSDTPRIRWGGVLASPEELDVPRWEGSPEENSSMIRAAARFFGAGQVGFVELDQHTRNLIYSYELDNKQLVFEDVDQAYETETKRVIPNKARCVIVFSVQMSDELHRRRIDRMPTALSAAASGIGYARGRTIIEALQAFLYQLGYQGLMGVWVNGLGIAPALGTMAGLGEIGRFNRLISPEYGPLQRIFRIITDLPLAPTQPIDAGIMRFCRTCKKCALMCPSGALSMETEPSWEVAGPWNHPGVRAYFDYGPRCWGYSEVLPAGCSTCFAVCPYTKKSKSFVHKIVSATIAKTKLLNSLFVRMDDLFGYSEPHDPESWWSLNLPPYSIDANNGTIYD